MTQMNHHDLFLSFKDICSCPPTTAEYWDVTDKNILVPKNFRIGFDNQKFAELKEHDS